MTLPALPQRTRNAWRVAFAAWGALLVLQIAWYGWWVQPISGPVLTLALVPLLLPLLALRRPNRALLWAGMFALFYFAHGISAAWTTPDVRALAIIEAVLCVVLIGALGAGVEFRKRRNGTPDAMTGSGEPSSRSG